MRHPRTSRSSAAPAGPLPAVERVLLVLHRAAGAGHGERALERLEAVLRAGLPRGVETRLCAAADHRAVHAATAGFLRRGGAAAVLAGGGGGTLRAIVEAVCASAGPGPLPGPQRLRLGALRMGSGNVLARRLGVPADPEAGLRALLRSLRAGRVQACTPMRLELGTAASGVVVRHAIALVGLGQLAPVPLDVQHWRRRCPRPFRTLTRCLGLERLTRLQYGLAFAARALRCALQPRRAELVEIEGPDGTRRRLRLLAGVALAGPVAGLPLEPVPGPHGAERPELCLLELPGRTALLRGVLAPRTLGGALHRVRLGPGQRASVRLLEHESSCVFLDEDPLVFHERLSISAAGRLAFLPARNDGGVP